MTKENKMGYKPIPGLLFSMSLPAICSMMLQAIYNIIDSVYVSRIGEDALAAVTLVFPIQMLIVAVGVGTGVGLNSLISRRLGEKRIDDANSAAAHGFLLAFFNWAIFLLIGGVFLKPFLRAFSDDPVLLAMADDYGVIVLCVTCFIFVQITLEKVLQATGNMIIPMASNMIGCIANLILDPYMIFGDFSLKAIGLPGVHISGLGLGTKGAAIATVIGQCVGMCVISGFFFLKKHPVKITFRGFKFSWGTIRDIYVVALPGMVMQAIPSLLNVWLNAILIGFSITAVSVLGVYFRLQSFVFMAVFGLTQGAMPIMGFNYGACNRHRLVEVTRLTTIVSSLIMLAGTIVFQLMPGQLMSIFDASDEMMSMGITAMKLLSLCFVPAAIGITFSTVFQALGHGMLSLIVTLLRQMFALLPAAWILAKLIGVTGVWISFPLAEIVSLICSVVFFWYIYKKEIASMPYQSTSLSGIED